ncbi:hypothetical protein J2T02_005663 [Chitinophaga terrae (ex Kim and Jung 2007)]|uniref:hypothetical protein n=1 Tax=Chitinophaga terrae (ex Kim and Jung 2007) TaxID=408074 RepID=UPI0027899650|nr:hypothetical protein [Chitinophaga terrae (ex Kim and Jung 2007)]MDQ0110511.1 hypothetical protein [Chitinophaga terrae (ex Kim and Jung 2007)]
MDIRQQMGSNIPLDQTLFNTLTEKKFTVKDFKDIDEAITYRTINYWSEKGYLLSLRQETDRDWRKINFAEYVWILLLNELRIMGVSFDKIIGQLFLEMGIPEKEQHEMSQQEADRLKALSFDKLLPEINKELVLENFTWLIVTIISYKTPITLRFLNNGDYLEVYGNPAYHGIAIQELLEKYKEQVIKSNFESSISVSIDGLIKDYIQKKDLDNITELNLLSPEEIEIISYARRNELAELKIVYNEGSPDRVELTEIIQSTPKGKRIEEYMLSNYTDLHFKSNGGKSLVLHRNTKIKLSK